MSRGQAPGPGRKGPGARQRTHAARRSEVREPESELTLRTLRRVGAVDEVVRHGKGEVAADRPRRGVGRVGGAHRGPDDTDRALTFERESERRRGGDELDELPEKRLLGVLGIVPLRELTV